MSLARAIALTDNRVYTGPAQYLSDPTDLRHLWSCRDVSRRSGFLGATLRRADGMEADFGYGTDGFLDRAAVLAWAGASAVTVARLWGLGGTQLGPELWVNADVSLLSYSGALPTYNEETETFLVERNSDNTISQYLEIPTQASKRYLIRFTVIKHPYYPVLNITVRESQVILYSSGVEGAHEYQLNSTLTTLRFSLGANTRGFTLSGVSVRELLTANAVQTTTASQPPLDLTANPLRIGALAGRSLVATLPAAITGARVLTADANGVALATADLASGAYTAQSANALRERVVLAADTPEADVEAVRRNMMRAWRLGAAA